MKKFLILLAACMMVLAGFGSTSAGDCNLCGDVTNDGNVDISDLTALISWIQWPPGPTPACPAMGDVNGDCGVTWADIYYLIDYMFEGGPAPICGCI